MNVDALFGEMTLQTRTLEKELRQMAEECAELTQASLKYIRTDEESYVKYEKALANLAEEIGDVENVIAGVKALMSVKHPDFQKTIDESREFKARRWTARAIEDGAKIDIDKYL